MAVLTGAFDSSLEGFGLAYHGLYVVEQDYTAGYLRLNSGRRIYSTEPNRSMIAGELSVIVDNDMPPVTVTLDDPEAELWPVAIATLHGESSLEVYPFSYRRTGFYRRDPATREFVYTVIEPARARTFQYPWTSIFIDPMYLTPLTPRLEVTKAEHSIPDVWLYQDATFAARWLDITPDGSRCLMIADLPSGNGPAFIAEITATDKFSRSSQSVVTDYGSIVSGGGRVEGDLAEKFARVVNLETGAVTWGVPYSPNLGEIYPEPKYSFFTYAVGTSSAASTGETVIGAWYNQSGVVELVRARWSVTERITASQPVPQLLRPHEWMSPFTTVNTVTLTIVAGSKATTPISITQTHSRPGPASGTVTLSASTGESFSRTYTPNFDAAHAVLTDVLAVAEANLYQGYGPALFADGGVELSLRAAPTGGVYMPVIDISRPQASYRELIAGDCITPKGVDRGVKRSGNVYASGAGEFMRAAYNPVTGEVERNRTDGATYAWV